MSVGWPQGIMLALIALQFTCAVLRGQDRNPDYLVFHVIGAAIGAAGLIGLLYWGGFFS